MVSVPASSQTRAEIAGQRTQMELQNSTLSRQTFENSFFELLLFSRNKVAHLSAQLAGPRSEMHTGLPAFEAGPPRGQTSERPISHL